MNKLLVERSANSDSMKSDLINLLGISRAGRRAAARLVRDPTAQASTKLNRSGPATAGSQAPCRVSGRLPVSPTRPGHRRHRGTVTQAASGWSGTMTQCRGQQRRARSPAGLPVRYHGDSENSEKLNSEKLKTRRIRIQVRVRVLDGIIKSESQLPSEACQGL